MTRPGGRRVSSRDVASKAGVSQSTVSLVLNGRTDARISEETRGRVLAAAAELRYVPSAAARSLRRGRTGILGFYCGHHYMDACIPFVGQVITGLQRGCDAHGRSLLLHGKHAGLAPEAIYAELANGRVDGLILFTTPSDPLVDLLAASTLPVVAIVDAIPGIPSVGVDDDGGGREQAGHLAARGHRRVLYQTLPNEHVSVEARREAFEREARSLGIHVRVRCGAPMTGRPDEGALADLTARGDGRPSAVVCWADECAHWLLAACAERERRVPDDLAIVGFDGVPMQAEPVLRLTTVKAPWQHVAETAVSLLMDRLSGKEVPRQTTLPVTFVIGNTS
ncbi:MAG: LacI family DNA-binding transcriptional regulator [Chthonomonadales bacterium]|nr:LacI family DNA-binding transcriptional regulator [Chthonomonadales bacterium]